MNISKQLLRTKIVITIIISIVSVFVFFLYLVNFNYNDINDVPVNIQAEKSCTNMYQFGPVDIPHGKTIESPTCGTDGCIPEKRKVISCDNGVLRTACRNQFDSEPAQACSNAIDIDPPCGSIDCNLDEKIDILDFACFVTKYNKYCE